MDKRELWLATTLVELADTRNADFDDAAYCHQLAISLAQLLAPAEIVVLIADGSGALRVVAASTERANLLSSLEADHGEAGLGVVSSLPMHRHGETVGVITVLAVAGHPLGETEISLAEALAEAAAVAILHQRALRRSTQAAEQLQHALDSRVLIEQAKGALAARLDITPEEAFGLLRGFARRNSRPLAEVARATIRGELPAQELLAGDHSGRRRAARQRSG